MMFSAIGFVWTAVGIIGSNLVARKIKEKETKSSTPTTTRVMDDIKNTVKSRIDSIEDLESTEIEDLIRIIRSLNSKQNEQAQ